MDVYSIGDGQFLEQVISAVTLASGSGEFATMAKIGVLFGVLLIMFQAVSSGGRGVNFTQLGAAGLVYALMFGSTQTVTVTDAYTQEVRVVDNVPTGLAAVGSFLTSIGYNLTELFETSFSTPAMTTQGYAFSLDTIKRVRMNSISEFHLGEANAAVPGANFYDSWSQYIKTCTLIGIELGFINKDDLFRSPDFISELQFDSVNHNALIKITPTPQSLPCDVAFDALEGFTQSAFLPSFKDNVLPGVLDLDQPAGAAEVEETINDALNGLGVGPAPQSNFTVNAAPPVEADDFIIASVLVPIYYKAVRDRYVQDGVFSYADQLDDAVRARNSQWMANQSLFDRYLRPMMTFIEGFIFAAVPILSLLIPIGAVGLGAAGRFVLVGAWIQLWMPALAIVNLFLHDVVAGKLAALSDAGSPLTSLAGLQQGDDIIQTWLATGGLMASAVPVLTLMLVYGGAISANFFATRLQGEDVVMERQAAGATFNPYEQLHVDPQQTFDQTAGIVKQTGAEGRVDTFSYNATAGAMRESASDARIQAVDQFSSDLRQSVGSTWNTQSMASAGQGFNQRIVAEGSQTESALQSHFGDVIRNLSAQTGMSLSDATQYVGGVAFGLSGSLGSANLGGSAGGNLGTSDIESKTLAAETHEQFSTIIADKMAENSEIKAGLSESAAADIQGNTSDALVSNETLGQDQTLGASAQDVVSSGQAYREAVNAGESMSATRTVSAMTLIPAIAASPEAASGLNDLIAQNGLAGEVQTYEHFHGDRDTASFGGNSDLAHTYAQAHVAAQHIGTGEENSAEIQAGLADVFQSAEGYGSYTGNATANSGIMDNAPGYGSTGTAVADGFSSGSTRVEQFDQDMATSRGAIEQGMGGVAAANADNTAMLDEAKRDHLGEHSENVAAQHRNQERAMKSVDLDGAVGTAEKAADGITTIPERIKELLD